MRKFQKIDKTSTNMKKKQTYKSNISAIYTDASIKNKQMGIGIWSSDENIAISRRIDGYTDINRAELVAIFCSLLYTRKTIPSNKIILTDSITSIKSIKGDVYCDKFSNITEYIQIILSNWDGYVRFQKVKGHSGDIGNNEADKLAGNSILVPNTKMFIIPDFINYENIVDMDKYFDYLYQLNFLDTKYAIASNGCSYELEEFPPTLFI